MNNGFQSTLDLSGLRYLIYDAAGALAQTGLRAYSHLPYILRVLAENIVRTEFDEDKKAVALSAIANRSREAKVPYRPSRVVLQDLLGTPALVDLAGLRDAIAARGGDPRLVNPKVPVQLIVDHSLNVEHWGESNAKDRNMAIEGIRNAERFDFLGWCSQAFDNLSIIPSGHGIVHQINLERLTSVIVTTSTDAGLIAYPDTLVGTDSHTTMINAIGVIGWGVGGIEAELAMLGKPLNMRLPEIVGVRLEGTPQSGILATDIALSLTELLRRVGVPGACLEFSGPGVEALSLSDRASISNMAPEFGAMAAVFPIDERTIDYLNMTGRSPEVCRLVRGYAIAQGLWCDALKNVEYDRIVSVNLSSIKRAIAGPKHPHQLITLGASMAEKKSQSKDLAAATNHKQNHQNARDAMAESIPNAAASSQRARALQSTALPDGAVVIAAITSCANTSNSRAVIAAGLLARRARARGLKRNAWTKTSFAPGSRVVAEYLSRAGLQDDLDSLGFHIVGFGCTTCNGMSGPLLSEELEQSIRREGTITTAVLSGNRNFEGRIHPLAREAYIMSPPLVVAYAIAGTSRIDIEHDPVGRSPEGDTVYLHELWPSDEEIDAIERQFVTRDVFAQAYEIVDSNVIASRDQKDALVPPCYRWNEDSTYIRRPPYWTEMFRPSDSPGYFCGMRPLVILGDHITTDHISPSGAILPDSAAGQYLRGLGVQLADFNSYGTRRSNHEVGMRATFASPRLRNELVDGVEGSITRLLPEGAIMSIFEAAQAYMARRQPLIVIAGREYGSGSSRDWAAKGPSLLGVRVVLAESFERIHRANLVGMGILPIQFLNGESRLRLGMNGDDTFDLEGVDDKLRPGHELTLCIRRCEGRFTRTKVLCCLETEEEAERLLHGGLLPQLLEEFLRNGNCFAHAAVVSTGSDPAQDEG